MVDSKPTKMRVSLWLEQGKCCCWCETELLIEKTTFEHLIPQWQGGQTKPFNLAISCIACNKERQEQVAPPHEKVSKSIWDKYEKALSALFHAKVRLLYINKSFPFSAEFKNQAIERDMKVIQEIANSLGMRISSNPVWHPKFRYPKFKCVAGRRLLLKPSVKQNGY